MTHYLKSYSPVKKHLDQLAAKGYIRRHAGLKRGITLVERDCCPHCGGAL